LFTHLSINMRATLRLLASVKPSRYLEPFAPTGLTGLTTHPSPRPTLIYIYRATLEKLKAFPESSVYRQSTEALTRHRLQIIESTKPPGFEAWFERVKKTVGAEPHRFASLRLDDGSYVGAQRDDGSDNPRGEEWDGEKLEATTEGPHRTPEQQARWEQAIDESVSSGAIESDFETLEMKWENEPALEAEQYAEITQPQSMAMIG
jgi:NADH dehydrogenase (ubiquinone) 1 alpha subcomplex subunit 5